MAGSQSICQKDATEGLGAYNLSAVTMEQIINMFNSYISNNTALEESFNTYISNTNLADLLDVNDLLGSAPIGSVFTKGIDNLWTSEILSLIMPIATTSTIGGVIVGNGLNVDVNGLISLDYSPLIATTSQMGIVQIGSGLNISSGLLSLNLPTATSLILGGVKIGNTLSITSGVLDYLLPTASSSVLGAIKVGTGLTITSGILSANPYILPSATSVVLGGIKVGTTLSMVSGILNYNLQIASSFLLGGIKVGSGLLIDNITGVLSTILTDPLDNILHWDNSKYIPYLDRYGADPGYAYFYLNQYNYPGYVNNSLTLDGNLFAINFNAYLNGNSFSANYSNYGIFLFDSDTSTESAILTESGDLIITSFTGSVVSRILIGDYQNNHNGEKLIIDDNNQLLNIAFTNINLSKGIADKWLKLDGSNNITYMDLPANTYIHPTQSIISPLLTGALVLGSLYVNELGHVTSATTRTLTLADLGYVEPLGAGSFINAIESSSLNTIPVFNDVTGNIVRESTATISSLGQISNSSVDDYSIYSYNSLYNGIYSQVDSLTGIALLAKSPYIPASFISLDITNTGTRNCLTLDTDSLNTTSVAINYATSIDWNGSSNRGSGASLVMHRELVTYTDVTTSVENNSKEWWLLKNGILTKTMWLTSHGDLHLTGAIFTDNVPYCAIITLPANSTVAGRISGATVITDYPYGWTLSSGANPNDLSILHNLNKRIIDVKIYSVNGSEETMLWFNEAYSGLIAANTNNLLIKNLATINLPIVIHLIFN